MHRRLGSGTSPAVRKACAIPPVEISSTPRSESPLAKSMSYALLDRSFARIVYAYIIYDRACVRARIYMYMHMHLYPHEFALVYMHKRKRSFLRAFACVSSRGVNYKRKTRLRAKYFNTQTHFGFRNFQDVLYAYTHVSIPLYMHTPHPCINTAIYTYTHVSILL